MPVTIFDPLTYATELLLKFKSDVTRGPSCYIIHCKRGDRQFKVEPNKQQCLKSAETDLRIQQLIG